MRKVLSVWVFGGFIDRPTLLNNTYSNDKLIAVDNLFVSLPMFKVDRPYFQKKKSQILRLISFI